MNEENKEGLGYSFDFSNQVSENNPTTVKNNEAAPIKPVEVPIDTVEPEVSSIKSPDNTAPVLSANQAQPTTNPSASIPNTTEAQNINPTPEVTKMESTVTPLENQAQFTANQPENNISPPASIESTEKPLVQENQPNEVLEEQTLENPKPVELKNINNQEEVEKKEENDNKGTFKFVVIIAVIVAAAICALPFIFKYLG